MFTLVAHSFLAVVGRMLQVLGCNVACHSTLLNSRHRSALLNLSFSVQPEGPYDVTFCSSQFKTLFRSSQSKLLCFRLRVHMM